MTKSWEQKKNLLHPGKFCSAKQIVDRIDRGEVQLHAGKTNLAEEMQYAVGAFFLLDRIQLSR